jgi:hypothetical protein
LWRGRAAPQKAPKVGITIGFESCNYESFAAAKMPSLDIVVSGFNPDRSFGNDLGSVLNSVLNREATI